ncbi:MAG: hypothetical protein U0269_25325 [Polyangiales bacterium]
MTGSKCHFASAFALAAVSFATVVRAQNSPNATASLVAQAQSDARILSAAPDAPVAALEWRNTLRGTVGVRIPIVGALHSTGFLLQLPAQIELHNADQAQPVPWQYWRGRLALEAAYRAAVASAARPLVLAATFAIEHESDHASTGEPGLVNLNSLSLRGDLSTALGPHVFTAALLTRLHVLTCTRHPIYCGNYGGGAGSVTFETALDLVFDARLSLSSPFRFFAALHGGWLVANALALQERRLALHLGFAVRPEQRGLFQLYATGQLGEDVGYFRYNGPQAQFGGGFRWGW